MARSRFSNRRTSRSSQGEVAAQLSLLKELAADPVALRATAIEFALHASSLEVVQAAVAALGAMQDPANREALHRRFAAATAKNDSGGFIRAAIIRALQPIVTLDDRPLLFQALTTYEHQGMHEIGGDLRVAALVAMNELEPEMAALFAARFLHDPGNSFGGQPGITAVRLLAAHQRLEPLFAVASWNQGPGEIVGETLRNLVDLPAELVDLLVARYKDATDEQILLGFYDLLLAHRAHARWRSLIVEFLRTTSLMDLYGLIAMQIVASRDGDLIAALREMANETDDRRKHELLVLALQHA